MRRCNLLTPNPYLEPSVSWYDVLSASGKPYQWGIIHRHHYHSLMLRTILTPSSNMSFDFCNTSARHAHTPHLYTVELLTNVAPILFVLAISIRDIGLTSWVYILTQEWHFAAGLHPDFISCVRSNNVKCCDVNSNFARLGKFTY